MPTLVKISEMVSNYREPQELIKIQTELQKVQSLLLEEHDYGHAEDIDESVNEGIFGL